MCNDIARLPCRYPLSALIRTQIQTPLGEVFSTGGAMQSHLERKMEHCPSQGVCRIRRTATSRERPGANDNQALNYMEGVRD